MLFLYRPRQTWMPHRVRRPLGEQDVYNGHLQAAFGATRQVPRYEPRPASNPAADRLRQLAELHASGVLTDAEFAAAKARVLNPTERAP
jgi:hypothetical protein